MNNADLRGLVSVSDKTRSGQFVSVLEHSQLSRIGLDIGLAHFVPEMWTPDPSRLECNIPLNEFGVRGDNAKNLQIDIYPNC